LISGCGFYIFAFQLRGGNSDTVTIKATLRLKFVTATRLKSGIVALHYRRTG